MTCQDCRERLGEYADDELAPGRADEVRAHLEICPRCRSEYEELCRLTHALAEPRDVPVPLDLWAAVERRLDALEQGPQRAIPRRWPHARHWRLATAAAVVLVSGLILLGLLTQQPAVAASQIDFSVLLDTLPFDPRAAFAKFVVQHHGTSVTPTEAIRSASSLNFSTPEVLPGGFHLQEVFTLRVGTDHGVAARYERNGEFLAAIFHPPVKKEEFGSHKDYPCVVGKHRGHAVAVGEWKMVHLTDPTTCHCLLSRLDEEREMPAILAAIAPGAANTTLHPGHD